MNKVTFEVDNDIDIKGTSKRGTITATFSEIVRVFGEPKRGNGSGIYNEWRIQFRVPDSLEDDDDFDYEIATIYDWAAQGDPMKYPTKEFKFMIGGMNMEAPYLVHQLLGK